MTRMPVPRAGRAPHGPKETFWASPPPNPQELRKIMASPEMPRIGIVEPAMRSIPEGWFWMGCDDGRDDEKPRHRVWVDSFELAACQTTNAGYACFMEAARHPKRLCWDDPG